MTGQAREEEVLLELEILVCEKGGELSVVQHFEAGSEA